MRLSLRFTGTVFALLALSALPAQAQLGSLLKKAAKKAVESKVDEKVEDATPVEPLAGDPVTASSLDALLKGLSLELESSAKSKELEAAIEAKGKEISDAERAAGNEPSAWHEANRSVENCVSNSLDKSRERYAKELPQKLQGLMATAAPGSETLIKFQAVSTAMKDALAKGDMKAYARAMTDYTKLLGFDFAKDSAAAFVTCGNLPPKPASLVKIERLQEESGKLSDQLRDLEMESEAHAAKAAGMPADKYAMARERLWAWSHALKNRKQGARALTKEENALFAARAEDIKRVESMLR